VQVPDSVSLTSHSRAGTIDEHSVLVNDIDNGGDFTGLGGILKDGDATNFNESLERLFFYLCVKKLHCSFQYL